MGFWGLKVGGPRQKKKKRDENKGARKPVQKGLVLQRRGKAVMVNELLWEAGTAPTYWGGGKEKSGLKKERCRERRGIGGNTHKRSAAFVTHKVGNT